MAKTKAIISILIVVSAISYNQYKNKKVLSPIVEISTGKLQGMVSYSRAGREVHEYLGIPFAKPPVGNLRFELPEPAEPWEGIRDATSFGPRCIQIDIITQQFYGEEDCLYLNVFVPKITGPKKPLPVMVFIHGGIFHYGSGDVFKSKYFADESVILVTIQYRLGALGFLNTGDGIVRGNMGLKDQVLALKWIQQNIKNFGGDRRKVTIFGESAGGSAVHLHMLSKMSKGLFQKGISQSGTAISPFILSRSPREAAIRYAEKFGCITNDTKAMVECMKTIDATTFVYGHEETLDVLHDPLAIFAASIETIDDENAFLTKDPRELLEKGKIENRVPWITGVNAEEGLILSAGFVQNKTLMKALNKDFNDVAPKILFYPRNDKASQKIRTQYFKSLKKITKKHKSKLTNLISDYVFFLPASESARLQSRYSPVYMYYYLHAGETSLAHMVVLFRGQYHYIIEFLLDSIKKWINLNIIDYKEMAVGICAFTDMCFGRPGVCVAFADQGIEVVAFADVQSLHKQNGHFLYLIPALDKGACHGDEMFLMFDTPIAKEITQEDGVHYKMSKDFVQLWTDYAADKTDLNFRGVKWTPIKPDKTLRYLLIDMSYGMVDEPFQKRIQFFRDNPVV